METMKVCEHCGEEFESTEYEDTYCSWDCQGACLLGEED